MVLATATLCGISEAASTLSGITTPDGQFVTVDAATGATGALSTLLTSPQTFAPPGVDAQDNTGLNYVIRHEENGDVLLGIDTASGAIFTSVVLTRPLSHLGFDGRSGLLFGITQPDQFGTSDFVQIDPRRGLISALTQPGSPQDGVFSQPGVDATDTVNGRFYVIRHASTGDSLLTIDTQTGAILSAAALTQQLVHLAFSTQQSALFGITGKNATGDFDLVRIDPATGAMTTLRIVGNEDQPFARPGVDAIDAANDFFYAIRTSAASDELVAINLATGSAESAVDVSVAFAHLFAASASGTAPGSLTLNVPANIDAEIGFPILLTVTATGSPAPTILADLFPFGSIISQTVSGNTTTTVLEFTPVFSGIFAFTILAQSGSQSTSAVLAINVQNIPSFTSTAFAFGIQNALFNLPLTLNSLMSANFSTSALPAGLTLSGSVITGAPTETGTFAVDLMAETTSGTARQRLLIKIVSSSDIGVGAGNGFPTGTPSAPTEMSIAKAAVDLNFAKPGRDRIALSGKLSVGRGFVAAGQTVSVSVNGIAQNFTLDAHGRAKSGAANLSVKSNGSFTAKFDHGAFSAAFTNALENATVSRQPRSIHIALDFGGGPLQSDVMLSYTAIQGKSGRGRN